MQAEEEEIEMLSYCVIITDALTWLWLYSAEEQGCCKQPYKKAEEQNPA